MLRRLWEAGVSVPYPMGWCAFGLAMQYIGTIDRAAPRLVDVKDRSQHTEALFDRIVEEVMRMLDACTVHADLSAFNILLLHGRPWIIDLPQAVDVAYNPNWRTLLRRDITNVCTHFARYGIVRDPGEVYDSVVTAVLPDRMS